MLINNHQILSGHFVINSYDATGKLIHTVDKPNLITETGLNYLVDLYIGDCFRYVSLGANSTPPVPSNTGLLSPSMDYQYIGGRHLSYSSSEFHGTGPGTSMYLNKGCGFTEDKNKISLKRSWRIPTGIEGFPTDDSFEEIMLTPGRPYSPNGHCRYCDATILNPGSSDEIIDQGLEASEVAKHYTYGTYYGDWGTYQNPYTLFGWSRNKLCDSFRAFSRITTPIPVVEGGFITVDYGLTVTFDSGVRYGSLTIDNQIGSPNNWYGDIGYMYSLTCPAIKLICDTTNAAEDTSWYRDDPNFYVPEYGETFISCWGCGLEPALPISRYLAYISTDAYQFTANHLSGGQMPWESYQPGSANGFAKPSGVMGWRWGRTKQLNWNSWPSYMTNIRSGYIFDYTLRWPQPISVRQTEYDLGVAYYQMTDPIAEMGYGAIIRTRLAEHVHQGDLITINDRTKQRFNAFDFTYWFTSDTFTLKDKVDPIRSFVISYYDDAAYRHHVIPVFDLIFQNRSGKFATSLQSIPGPTYKYNIDQENGVTYPTGYWFLDGTRQLIFQMAKSWSTV